MADISKITLPNNNQYDIKDNVARGQIENLQSELENKVDKITGKTLSTNDYTTAEKNKLANIESEANKTIIDSVLSSTSENPLQNKIINTALSEKLGVSGDSKNNIVTFTSSDTTDANVTSWISEDQLTSGVTHSNFFAKASKMFNNIRYLFKLLGTVDISTIGNGTVTGAINQLNTYTNTINNDTVHFSYINDTNIIQDGTDLDTFVTPGTYRCWSSATAATLLHCPVSETNTKSGFRLYVLPTGYGVEPIQYGMQILIASAASDGVGRIFYRNQTGTDSNYYWKEWQQIYTNIRSAYTRKTLTSPNLLSKNTIAGLYYVTNATNTPSDAAVNGYYDVNIREFNGSTTRFVTYRPYNATDIIYINRLNTSTEEWIGWIKLPTRLEINALKSNKISVSRDDSTLLTSGQNLNDLNIGNYYSNSSSLTNSLINIPANLDSAFRLFVTDIGYGTNAYRTQTLVARIGMYWRCIDSNTNTWSDWNNFANQSIDSVKINKELTTIYTWTPHIYDFNTKVRELSNAGSYFKFGKIYIAWIGAENVNYTGISTMLQFRNAPCNTILGGTCYFADMKDGTTGASRVIQRSSTGIWPRPNIKSTDFNTPSGNGITNITFIGADL